jgi:hypothetical protein
MRFISHRGTETRSSVRNTSNHSELQLIDIILNLEFKIKNSVSPCEVFRDTPLTDVRRIPCL